MNLFERLLGRSIGDATSLATFRHNGLGVEFQHPEGWLPKYTDGPLLMLPPEPRQLSDAGDVYVLGMMLMAGQNGDFRRSRGAALEQFVNANASNFDGYKFLSKRQMHLSSGQEAIEFCFDFKKGTHLMRSHAMIAIREDWLVLLDMSGLKSEIKPRTSLCQKIVRTLRL